MKKLFICFLIVVAGCSSVFAQERVIIESSYNEWMRKAIEFLRKENYREKTVLESCRNDNCVWKLEETSVTEHDLPGKMRVTGINSMKGVDEPMGEWRFIDNKIYVKRPGLDWQTEERKPPATPNSTREDARIEYKDLGIERSGLDEMKVLSRTAFVRLSVNGVESESVQTIKTWIDRSGRFKKQEYLWTDSRRVSRRTISYELDSTIKIEAPIK